jgi:hypothetical protein
MTSKILRLRRGTTAAHSCYVGPSGEVTIDTDKNVVVIHDGSTPGGFPALTQSSLIENLPIATNSTLGTIRIGSGITIDPISGIASVDVNNIGNLSVNDQTVVGSNINGDIAIAPNGSGKVVLSGLKYPNIDGDDRQVLTTDGEGNLYWSRSSSVSFGSTPPPDPNNGDIWVDTASGVEYTYYNDGTSSQWVEFGSPSGYTDEQDLTAITSDVMPAVNDFYRLGSASKQWKNLYVSDGITINGSTVSVNQNQNLVVADQLMATQSYVDAAIAAAIANLPINYDGGAAATEYDPEALTIDGGSASSDFTGVALDGGLA